MSKLMPRTKALEWKEGACYLLDQTKIPWAETYIRCDNYRQVIDAIRSLSVRGAPLIGIAGAYACVLAARESSSHENPLEFLNRAMTEIETARPTAVNLQWAVRKMRSKMTRPDLLLAEAKALHNDDIECNIRMAYHGAELFQKGSSVLTCCNTGDLATGGIGTAFGVLRAGHAKGRIQHVYACETRPVLQGLRLTAWELERSQIPFTVICDNMAATLMKEGKITHVITGADRIAANGDSANKIGTYSLAVLAKHHGIPFYIAAPFSTFDLSVASGSAIPIEQRDPLEVTRVLGEVSSVPPVHNPSFDVTPADLITALISDRGVIQAPTVDKVRKLHGENECHA